METVAPSAARTDPPDTADGAPPEAPEVAQPPEVAPRRAPIRELVLVGGAALLVILAVLRPWPLDEPIAYRADTFQHLALIDTLDWTGTPGDTAELNAPHGLDWSSVPTGTERLHLVVLWALRSLTGSAIGAMNLHAVLALLATAVVTHAVLRRIGCRRSMSAVLALVFALSPAALQRLQVGHTFLFALYPTALAVYLVLWCRDRTRDAPAPTTPRDRGGTRWGTWGMPIAAAVVIALSSAYGTVFASLVLLGTGALVAVRHSSIRQLAAPVLLVLVMGGVAGISLLPDLLAHRGDPVGQAWERPVSDSESYGLRLTRLVAPRSDHQIPFLADWGERAGRVRAPVDTSVALGLLGTAGLAALAWAVVRRAGRPRDHVDDRMMDLAGITAVVLVFATAGAGGFLLATFGFTQIRVWSRLAPFVLLCSLAALGLVIDRRVARSALYVHVVVVLAAIAWIDGGPLLPGREQVAAQVREDRALVSELAAELEPGAVVAQLPYVPFPDHLGSGRLLAPAIHSTAGLRFTAGSFTGGAGDWQASWLDHEPGDAARAAAVAGFDALLVQLDHHLVEDPGAMRDSIEEVVGPPAHLTPGGSWAWYDLRELRARLVETHGDQEVERAGRAITRSIGVTYEGSAGQVFDDEGASTLLGSDGAVVLHVDDPGGSASVSFVVETQRGARVRVTGGTRPVQVEVDERATVSVEVPLDAPEVRLRLHTDGPPLRAPGADGPASVRISDVTVRDTAATRSPALR